MGKLYVQNFPEVWQSTASQAAGASAGGCAICNGYARILGVLISSASADSSSGLRILQSADQGAHWDTWVDYVPSACSASSFSIDIIGNAVRVQFKPHGAADEVRTLWQLRPV